MTSSWEVVNEEKIWENDAIPKNFLQSFAFGTFHENLGHRVWRLKSSFGICQVVEMSSKSGKFFYIPGGPVLTNWDSGLSSLVDYLVNLGKKEKVSFVRFDPRTKDDSAEQSLQKLGLKKAPFFTQPENSLILDLTKPIEDLRHDLSESTRYNIGWVARQGVTVKVSQERGDIDKFLKLLQETSIRQGFRLTDQDYYREQFAAFLERGQAKLYLTYGAGEFAGKLLASAIVIYYSDTVTYLHAASSNLAPKLRAPYLQQWVIITDAKDAGFSHYDFWGVSKNDNPKDPWAGVTAFKQSFGGERVSYQRPYDLVLSSSYYYQVFVEKLRKLIYRQH